MSIRRLKHETIRNTNLKTNLKLIQRFLSYRQWTPDSRLQTPRRQTPDYRHDGNNKHLTVLNKGKDEKAQKDELFYEV